MNASGYPVRTTTSEDGRLLLLGAKQPGRGVTDTRWAPAPDARLASWSVLLRHIHPYACPGTRPCFYESRPASTIWPEACAVADVILNRIIEQRERDDLIKELSPDLAQMLRDDPRLERLSNEELRALNACIGGGGELPGLDLEALAAHEVM